MRTNFSSATRYWGDHSAPSASLNGVRGGEFSLALQNMVSVCVHGSSQVACIKVFDNYPHVLRNYIVEEKQKQAG